MKYNIPLIQETLIFKNLSTFEVKQIFEECTTLQEYSINDKILEEGSLNDDLFFIAKGKIKVCIEAGVVTNQQLEIIEGPLIIGELSFLDKNPRGITIKASENISIYVINGRFLDKLIVEMPDMGHKIKHNIALSIAEIVRRTNKMLSEEVKKSYILQKRTSSLVAKNYRETINKLASQIKLSV